MAKRDRILLVAVTRLGDLLQASPTIAGLKKQYPHAKITIAVDTNFSSVCSGLPGVDEVYVINLATIFHHAKREKTGIVEAYAALNKVVEELRDKKFDYCINISSSAYTALLLKMVQAPENRGWVSDDEGQRLITDPWARLFCAHVYHSNREYNAINIVDNFRCSAMVTEHPRKLMYEVQEASALKVQELFTRLEGWDGSAPFICIQAGASQPKRQWPAERFAALTNMLSRELGANILFTGSKAEKSVIDDVLSRCTGKNVWSVAGETSVGELGAILKSADLLVTGDTGPMHMSVAVGTPVVALFLASAFCFETGPYGEGNIVLEPQVSCHPCNPNFDCSRPDCHEQISPQLVFELVRWRLSKEFSIERFPVSAEVADRREVGVYVTEFDEDGFLDFRPMNGAATRNGLEWQYYAAARAAYKQIWKEEFGVLSKSLSEEINSSQLQRTDLGLPVAGIEQAIVLTQEGSQLIQELQKLILDEKSPAKLLGEVTQRINSIDDRIESTGLTNPAIGAAIRMFIIEKQNMRGNNPFEIASEMKQIYESLGRRVQKFRCYFGHYRKQVDERALVQLGRIG